MKNYCEFISNLIIMSSKTKLLIRCILFVIVTLNHGALIQVYAVETNRLSEIDSQKENLEKHIQDSTDIVLVSVYKEKWIPADKILPKGQFVYYSRIVRVIKGNLVLDRKIEHRVSIEDAPGWLKAFETSVKGELFYLFLGEQEAARDKDGNYAVEAPNPFRFSLNNSIFSSLMNKKFR